MTFHRVSALFTWIPLLVALLATPVIAQGGVPQCSAGGNFQGGSATYHLRADASASVAVRIVTGVQISEGLIEKETLPAILDVQLPMLAGNYMSNSLSTLYAGYYLDKKYSDFPLLWRTTLSMDGSELRTYQTVNLDQPGPGELEMHRTQTYINLGSTDALVAAIREGKTVNVKVAIEGMPEAFYTTDLYLARLTPILASFDNADVKLREMMSAGQCVPAP